MISNQAESFGRPLTFLSLRSSAAQLLESLPLPYLGEGETENDNAQGESFESSIRLTAKASLDLEAMPGLLPLGGERKEAGLATPIFAGDIVNNLLFCIQVSKLFLSR